MKDINNFLDLASGASLFDDTEINGLEAVMPPPRAKALYRNTRRWSPGTSKQEDITPQGAELLRLLTEGNYANKKFVLNLGLNVSSSSMVSGWCVKGLPSKHGAIASKLLNCDPALIVREYSQCSTRHANPAAGAYVRSNKTRERATPAGNKLSSLLIERSLSAPELAVHCDVTPVSVYLWLTKGVSSRQASKVAQLLQCDPSDIAVRHRPPPASSARHTAGARLLQLVRTHQSVTDEQIATAAKVGRYCQKSWYRTGVPSRHVDVVANLLGCQPEDIQSTPIKNRPENIEGQTPEGKEFDQLLMASGIGKQGLANRLDIDPSTIYKWNIKGVPAKHAQSVADILYCDDVLGIIATPLPSRKKQKNEIAGANLARLRRQKYGTQKDLALALPFYVCLSGLSGWEKNGVPASRVVEVAAVIGCEPSEISASDISAIKKARSPSPAGQAMKNLCVLRGLRGSALAERLGISTTQAYKMLIHGVPRVRAAYVAEKLGFTLADMEPAIKSNSAPTPATPSAQGTALRAIFDRHNTTTRAFASLLSVNPSTIYSWLTDGVPPSKIDYVASILHCTPAEIAAITRADTQGER